jgi:hypothetical protein
MALTRQPAAARSGGWWVVFTQPVRAHFFNRQLTMVWL